MSSVNPDLPHRWSGVSAADLLERAGTKDDDAASSLLVRASTGYARRFALDEVSDLVLATHVEDEVLSSGHGFPLRVVAPAHRGYSWVKWIVELEGAAIQLLDEVSRVTTTTWVTRRPPDFREEPFTEERGRTAVAQVEDRVRRGLPPRSVVSVTGLPVTLANEGMRARGVLNPLPMCGEFLEDGVRWPDGTFFRAEVIPWCTGFRSSLDHLAPLMLREPGGGITMTGKLATRVAKDPRVHLVGYGPQHPPSARIVPVRSWQGS